jgi:hypothetical protein
MFSEEGGVFTLLLMKYRKNFVLLGNAREEVFASTSSSDFPFRLEKSNQELARRTGKNFSRDFNPMVQFRVSK